MSASAITLASASAVVALSWILIIFRWWRRPKELLSVGPAGIESALRDLADLRSDDAVIRLDGANFHDHFEVRFVEDQFRFEYQVVYPEQLQNEGRIRSAFASLGYECQ